MQLEKRQGTYIVAIYIMIMNDGRLLGKLSILLSSFRIFCAVME